MTEVIGHRFFRDKLSLFYACTFHLLCLKIRLVGNLRFFRSSLFDFARLNWVRSTKLDLPIFMVLFSNVRFPSFLNLLQFREHF